MSYTIRPTTQPGWKWIECDRCHESIPKATTFTTVLDQWRRDHLCTDLVDRELRAEATAR